MFKTPETKGTIANVKLPQKNQPMSLSTESLGENLHSVEVI